MKMLIFKQQMVKYEYVEKCLYKLYLFYTLGFIIFGEHSEVTYILKYMENHVVKQIIEAKTYVKLNLMHHI